MDICPSKFNSYWSCLTKENNRTRPTQSVKAQLSRPSKTPTGLTTHQPARRPPRLPRRFLSNPLLPPPAAVALAARQPPSPSPRRRRRCRPRRRPSSPARTRGSSGARLNLKPPPRAPSLPLPLLAGMLTPSRGFLLNSASEDGARMALRWCAAASSRCRRGCGARGAP